MQSRLGILCDKLLEAGWLAALIVAPLFFDVYSSRVFEPDKIALVRSIALLMIGAWIILQLEQAKSNSPSREILRKWFQDNPLLLPTAFVILAYIVSTLFSIVPTISLWGSYQRLQGTYTTFSYIVIFLIAANSMRLREQFNRAINTALVVSFPIAFYGLVQHYKLDPLPWGGDVTFRVASNLGNSIFVAAYLILLVPLAAARWFESLGRMNSSNEKKIVAGVALAALIVLFLFDIALGTALAISFMILALVIALLKKANARDALLLATYTIILAVQIVTIIFAQSRGPILGLGAGLIAFASLYALARGARKIALGAIGLAIAALVFFAIFNFTPVLDPLKGVPYVGRLGQVFEGPTSKVRELIWQGAAKLVLPHAPVWSPITGDDAFNLIRPLVGYGPEAMYVVYNPFYPPELAHYEQRNASPDRSHNETFDALVMTGLFGFATYIFLFLSIFQFGLRGLGVIRSSRERIMFFALSLVSGLVVALAFGFLRGWNFIGVALPVGMILGMFVYLLTLTLISPSPFSLSRIDGGGRRGTEGVEGGGSLWISALVAALIAHFVEIHFGIAIVSTRLYFWFFAALLVALGTNRLAEGAAVPASVQSSPRAPLEQSTARENVGEGRRRAKRRRESASRLRARNEGDPREHSFAPVLAWTMITASILVTLAFEFVNNQGNNVNALDIVRRSFFSKGDAASYGIFVMVTLTWLIAGIVGLDRLPTQEPRWISIALFVITSFTFGLWFMLFQTRTMTQPGDPGDLLANLLGVYYLTMFILIGAFAICLWLDESRNIRIFSRSMFSAAAIPIVAGTAAFMIYYANFSTVAGDILYKSATSYDNLGAFERSIEVYDRALKMQPNQDYYYLFLGRAQLEAARAASDPKKRAEGLNASEQSLARAQQLNPLNTDHTANLARLNRIWATLVDGPADKKLHLKKSSDYYQVATRLSPNTAYLYNEWSQTYIQNDDFDNARAALERSVQIDSQFAQSYLYLGEFYRSRKDFENAAQNYLKAVSLDPNALENPNASLSSGPMAVLAQPAISARAIDAYRQVLARDPNSVSAHLVLAELYKRSNQIELARKELEQAVKGAPEDYSANLALVNFLSETGQIDAALAAMRRVLELFPSGSDNARFREFYSQLQNLKRAIEAAQKNPSDVSAHQALAVLWKSRGQPQFALTEYQTIARLAPNDYDAQKNIVLMNLMSSRNDDAERALVTAAALAPEKEKPLWQNLQMAINDSKSQQFDRAIKNIQAALAFANDADKAVLQALVTQLQEQGK